MADDDEDDVILVRDAFERSKLLNDLRVVADGVELMEYLRREGRYSDPALAPRPDIILLDLNMPKMDGREALKEIKEDPDLKSIPIVVLTTSHVYKDVVQTYTHGANSYIPKPVTFEGMCEAVRKFNDYWFQIVKLPADRGDG